MEIGEEKEMKKIGKSMCKIREKAFLIAQQLGKKVIRDWFWKSFNYIFKTKNLKIACPTTRGSAKIK